MLARVFLGMGLLALGYLVGREIGRNESLREELARSEARQGGVSQATGEPAPEGGDAPAGPERRA